MCTLKLSSVLVVAAILTSCASKGELERVNARLDQVEAGLLQNQRQIKSELASLYEESENEFSRIARELKRIGNKTDQFDVQVQGGALLLIPTGSRLSRDNTTPLESSAPVTGLRNIDFWHSSGGRDANSEGNKMYELTVDEPGQAVVDLESKGANAYLYLASDDGHVIAKDDDSGKNQNARIALFLERGRYLVVAATFERAESAPFTLSISGVKVSLDPL